MKRNLNTQMIITAQWGTNTINKVQHEVWMTEDGRKDAHLLLRPFGSTRLL